MGSDPLAAAGPPGDRQSYCRISVSHPLHRAYHDSEYGFPAVDEAVLFERLALEIQQAGLSWLTVLKKREALRRAFDGFQVEAVARYGPDEHARLMANDEIIRNRRKIQAIVANARQLLLLRERDGGFAAWLDAQHPLPLDAWVRRFRANFRFVGPEIVREFLVSLGYLPGAHEADCPVYAHIALLNPPWRRTAAVQPEP